VWEIPRGKSFWTRTQFVGTLPFTSRKGQEYRTIITLRPQELTGSYAFVPPRSQPTRRYLWL